MRRVKLYCLLRAGSSWTTTVCSSVEDAVGLWRDAFRASSEVTGLIHVGTGRPSEGALELAIGSSFRGRVLATAAARWALPDSFRFSARPVRNVDASYDCCALPLFLAVSGWGYEADISEAREEPLTPEWPRFEGSGPDEWITLLQGTRPALFDVLATQRMLADSAYINGRGTLPSKLREALDDFRYLARRDSVDLDDPLAVLAIAPLALYATPLSVLGTTVRIRNVFGRYPLKVVGDLREYTHDRLMHLPHFGRKSCVHLARALVARIENPGLSDADNRQQTALGRSLRIHVESALEELEPRAQTVMRRRIGLPSPPETLEAIAVTLGVSRERIRQIERNAVRVIIEEEYWDDVLSDRLERLLLGRTEPLYLDLIHVEDPWFAGFEQELDSLAAVVETFTDTKFKALTIHGRLVVAQLGTVEWLEILRDVRASLRAAEEERWPAKQVDIFLEGCLRTRGGLSLKPLLLQELSGRWAKLLAPESMRERSGLSQDIPGSTTPTRRADIA